MRTSDHPLLGADRSADGSGSFRCNFHEIALVGPESNSDLRIRQIERVHFAGAKIIGGTPGVGSPSRSVDHALRRSPGHASHAAFEVPFILAINDKGVSRC